MFSDLQSAATLRPGQTELTPACSTVSDGVADWEQLEFGAQAAVGVAERLELRARFAHVEADAGRAEAFGGGPKVALVRDRLSVYLPIGRAFGADVEEPGKSWMVHPTLLFSTPLSPRLDLNASAKYLVFLNDPEAKNMLALNAGLGWHRGKKLVIRPEIGVLRDPKEGVTHLQASVGVSVRSGARDVEKRSAAPPAARPPRPQPEPAVPQVERPTGTTEDNPAACGDGLDNDGDGLMDCDDPGCRCRPSGQ